MKICILEGNHYNTFDPQTVMWGWLVVLVDLAGIQQLRVTKTRH